MEAEAALVVAFAREVIVDARRDGRASLCFAVRKRWGPPPDSEKDVAPEVAQSSDEEPQQQNRRHDHGGEMHLVDQRWSWICLDVHSLYTAPTRLGGMLTETNA